MAKASDNKFPKVQFSEEVAPATPAAGEAVIYVKADGKLYLKDDAGTETDLTAAGASSPLTTKGDVYGFSTVNARIPVGANDTVLTADSAQALGVKWAAAAGGGVPDWVSHLAAADDTPTAEDNFDDATIGLTNIATTGTVSWTEKRDLLSGKSAGTASGDLDMQVYALPGGATSAPVTIETRANLFVFGGTNAPRVFLGFTDGTAATSNVVGVSHMNSTNNHSAGTVTALTAETTIGGLTYVDWVHMRVVWISANTFQVQMSPDGVTWTHGGITSFASTITPTHYGVGVSSFAHGEDTIGSFEFLRVYASDLSV